MDQLANPPPSPSSNTSVEVVTAATPVAMQGKMNVKAIQAQVKVDSKEILVDDVERKGEEEKEEKKKNKDEKESRQQKQTEHEEEHLASCNLSDTFPLGFRDSHRAYSRAALRAKKDGAGVCRCVAETA